MQVKTVECTLNYSFEPNQCAVILAILGRVLECLSVDILRIILNELAHDKTYNKTCVISEDSDQPSHPHDGIRLLQPLGHPKRDKREFLLYRVDVHADLSLCWSHRSYCRFYRALAHVLYL